jgi:hypothetical protein
MERRGELTVENGWGGKCPEFVRQNDGRHEPDKLGDSVLESGVHQADNKCWNEAECKYV